MLADGHRHHAVLTNSQLTMLQAETCHGGASGRSLAIQDAIKHGNDSNLKLSPTTYVANETMRLQAEKAAAARQMRLDPAKPGVYLSPTFALGRRVQVYSATGRGPCGGLTEVPPVGDDGVHPRDRGNESLSQTHGLVRPPRRRQPKAPR
jgi:hypothetical protein